MEPDSKTEKDYACTGFIFLQNNWPEFLLATPARAWARYVIVCCSPKFKK